MKSNAITEVIAAFDQHYAAFSSFFRKPLLIVGPILLFLAFLVIRMHSFLGISIETRDKMTFMVLIFAAMGLFETLLSAGKYKTLLNFYDTGVMQEVLLKNYFARMPTLAIAYFFSAVSFIMFGVSLLVGPFIYFFVLHKKVLEHGRTFNAILFIICLILLGALALFVFLYFRHRLRFTMLGITDKNLGLWNAITYSWSLTAVGFFALRDMDHGIDAQFKGSVASRAAKNKMSNTILYRTLESQYTSTQRN